MRIAILHVPTLRFYTSLLYDFTYLYVTILLESFFIPATRSFALEMDSSPCRLARSDNDEPECDAIALSCPIFQWTIGYSALDGRVVY
jgi:hypothetical protein